MSKRSSNNTRPHLVLGADRTVEVRFDEKTRRYKRWENGAFGTVVAREKVLDTKTGKAPSPPSKKAVGVADPPPRMPPRPIPPKPEGAGGRRGDDVLEDHSSSTGGMPQWGWGIIAIAIAVAIITAGGSVAYRVVTTTDDDSDVVATSPSSDDDFIRNEDGMIRRITIRDPNGRPFSCWGVAPQTRRVQGGMQLYCPE
tara:strand:- start:1451 stop:2044 length:594 start_codon:yes stop_codon:yes gene_type:complete